MKPPGYDAALAGAVLVDRTDRGLLRLFGRDPVRMVQGLVSNDVQSLDPGQATYATMLTATGRMLADLRVIRRSDDLLLEADQAALPNIRDTLTRFVPPLFARAEDIGNALSVIGVYGPASTRILVELFSPVPVPAGDVEPVERSSGDDVTAISSPLDQLPVDSATFAAFGDAVPILIRSDYAGVDGWDIVVETSAADRVRDAIRAAGAEPATLETLEVLRIEAGRPRWGAELTEDVIPLEAGLKDRAISTSKGCYVGQEVVIRVLHRGHVNRNLRGILTGDGALSQPGTELFRSADAATKAGRSVARITSSAFSPRLGRAIAIAYVRREVEPGEAILLGSADGIPAEVVALPFNSGPSTGPAV